MTQHYSDPARETDPHALPDVEVFHVAPARVDARGYCHEPAVDLPPGWYWQACFPGCLPDGEPVGPFNSEQAALEDAQGGAR